MTAVRESTADRISRRYHAIQSECAITTAADAAYGPFLLNLVSSIHRNFPDHPHLYVFDLGLSTSQRRELDQVPWLDVRSVPPFVSHWKKNWTWKHYIAQQPTERYILHLDAGTVVLRSLALWFLAIERHGYIAMAQDQTLADMTPSEFWPLLDVDRDQFAEVDTVGAGVFGFDRDSPAGAAVREAFAYAKAGWTLGCSPAEPNPVFDRSIDRDCPRFRHDQTLLNLAMRKRYGLNILLRPMRRYTGVGNRNDHPRQYLWWARRRLESLGPFLQPLHGRTTLFWRNRVSALITIVPRQIAGRLRRRFQAA